MANAIVIPGLKTIDPIQGLVNYVDDIKPYHTKIFEVMTTYVYMDQLNVTITDTLNLSVNSAINDDIDVTFTETSFTESLEFFASAGDQPTYAIVGGGGSLSLGTAGSYAVLAYSTITNVGSSVLTGDLGLYPGTSVTGFPPGVVSGTQNIANGAANTAMLDATAAFVAGNALVGAITIPAELEAVTLTPGIYQFTGGAALLSHSSTGTVTLNGNGTYIFQIASALTVAAGTTVLLTGGATAATVYWLVGSSATFAGTTTFNGTIIAQASISMASGGTVNGHLFALTGAVTFGGAGETVTATPAGSATTVSISGDVTNQIYSNSVLTDSNGAHFLVEMSSYDSITNSTTITLNTSGIVGPVTVTPPAYAFQYPIQQAIPAGIVTTIDPAVPSRVFTNAVFLVDLNVSQAIQPGFVFNVIGGTPNDNTYYCVYVLFDPLTNVSTIGVSTDVVAMNAMGYVSNIIIDGRAITTGYDSPYDELYDQQAGSRIIYPGP